MPTPDLAHYSGPDTVTGKYRYTNLATGDFILSDTPPSPEQQNAWLADNPGSGTIAQTQATPAPFQPDTQLGGPSEDSVAPAATNSGVGAGTSTDPYNARGNDNTPPTTSNSTQQVINQSFASQPIMPQPNVLDQYASYTYAISWWLLTPDQYNSLTGDAPAKEIGRAHV